jgi:hypothetical protein
MPVPALSGSSFIADVGQLGVLPADGADSCVLSFGAVRGMSSEGMSTTTTARRRPEPTTQASPSVRNLEFG